MKELKVILGEKTSDTHILVDNQAIGYIQELKIHVEVNSSAPQIEIIFPDFRQISLALADKVAEQVNLLKDLPHVKVVLKKFDSP